MVDPFWAAPNFMSIFYFKLPSSSFSSPPHPPRPSWADARELDVKAAGGGTRTQIKGAEKEDAKCYGQEKQIITRPNAKKFKRFSSVVFQQ